MESTSEISIIYTCGLCSQKCIFDGIERHPCIQGYEHIVLTESHHFYPRTADGNIVENNQGQSDCANTSSIKENIDPNHDVTIASMEELLIAAVQERPPLWNYKDLALSQRTKAIKDKLWQEIEELLNTNREKKQYTIAVIKMKWKNLYDTYRTNLTKEKGKSGQAARKNKPWRFMDQMSFLKDAFDLGIRNTVSNLTLPTPEDTTVLNDDQHSDNLHTSEDYELNKGNKKRKADDAMERIANALSEPIPQPIMQQPLLPMPQLKERNEVDNFCLTINKKLQNLPPKKGNVAMFKIYELLFKYENEDD